MKIFQFLFYFVFPSLFVGLYDNTFAFPNAPPATALINIFQLSLCSFKAKKNIIIYSPFGEWVFNRFCINNPTLRNGKKVREKDGNCKAEIIIYKIS